jgi:hypothetical protein
MKRSVAQAIAGMICGGVVFAVASERGAVSGPDYLKKRLGLDKVQGGATSRPAQRPVMRGWSGLPEGLPFLAGWRLVEDPSVVILMNEGICRSYVLKGVTDESAGGGREVRFDVFVGVSASCAMDMAVRQMALTSMPLDTYADQLMLNQGGPGDLSIESRSTKGQPLGVVMFVRDNVAVLFKDYCDGLAEGIDAEIGKGKGISQEEYESILPLPVVNGATVDMGGRNPQYGRLSVTLSGWPKSPNLVVAGLQQGGPNGVFITSEGRFEFARVRGRESRGQKFGIVVYDRETLLSRWIMGDIPEANRGPGE